MIKTQLPLAKTYDLLDSDVFSRLVRHPKQIGETKDNFEAHVIVLDEIQKLPILLDEVHRLIEEKKFTFLLCGSSARKLKRGASNLLAGRAWEAALFPLVSTEIPNFDLLAFLNTGGLPHVYGNPDAHEELRSYVNLYLREEIQQEALTRNLRGFAEFLDVIAMGNGEELNYEGIASDCGIAARTVQNYVQILEDTLLGFCLPAFAKTKKRKAIRRAKHYLFDLGVTNVLCNRPHIKPKSELFGRAFEHFVIQEVRAYISYARRNLRLQYWRSTSRFEVDLIIENKMAIELKATDYVTKRHLKGLRALKEEQLLEQYVVICLEPEERCTDDNIRIIPIQQALKELWEHRLF